jgi:hypothetical protein
MVHGEQSIHGWDTDCGVLCIAFAVFLGISAAGGEVADLAVNSGRQRPRAVNCVIKRPKSPGTSPPR